MKIFKTFGFYFALLGVVLAIILANYFGKPLPSAKYAVKPSANPFSQAIAASAIVEAKDKNIEIGAPEEGVVERLWVKVGDEVKEQDPLFRIDTRSLEAELLVQSADLTVAKANLERLEEQLNRLKSVRDPRAISIEDLTTRENDVRVAEAKVEAAKAKVLKTKKLINRLTVRAPSDGIILQVNIRIGENVARNQPAIILGNLEHLQLRVDIDEQNSAFFSRESPAIAFPKNNTSIAIPLRFSRIEPFVIPKKSLTGRSEERVDTRVLQVIYLFDQPKDYHMYVGQQADVYIEKKQQASPHEG